VLRLENERAAFASRAAKCAVVDKLNRCAIGPLQQMELRWPRKK
jgi:hypothetical protein